jgi:hypothetical protein
VPSISCTFRPFPSSFCAVSVSYGMEGAYIGPQLKAARKLRGIRNTGDLARKINRPGFGEKVIGQVERDARQAKDYELQWLAEALEMTVQDLVREPAPAAGDHITAKLEALDAKLDRVLAGQLLINAKLDALDQIRTETGALLPGIAELLRLEGQEE